MASRQDSCDFWRNDPVLEILKGKFNIANSKIVLAAVICTATCHYLLGSIADYIYTGSGYRLTHPAYLYFTLAWLIVFTPIIWMFYLWQPVAVDRVLDRLEENNAIGPIIKENNPPVQSFSGFRKRFASSLTHKYWYFLAFIVIVVTWVYAYYFVWPSEFQNLGRIGFWFEIKWFTPFFVIGYSITLYPLWVFLIKHIIIIFFFNRLFYWFGANVKPIYPDEAGGLGAIGEFITQAAMLAVGVGVLAVAFGIQVWFAYGSFFRIDVLTFFGVYILTTALSIILPMLSAHQAMKEERSKNLEDVSQEFSKVLSNLNTTITADAVTIKETNEKLSELKQTYQHIYGAFPVWPISLRLARNFSITATLPLLSGLISVVIQYATS